MKRSKIIVMTLILVMCSVASGFAANPIITSIFTADPAALVYNGTVYLYTGHDEASASGTAYVMNNWACFSSTDMVNWTSHGYPLSVSAFSWAKADAWASQVVYRNGKFYWYICAEHRTIAGKAIGVAVSTSPTGPFTDAIGSALITNNMTTQTSIAWDDIDPTVFIDDDGQAYMYWGNTVCKYVRLNSDMISYSGSITTVSLSSFTEAPWLHKRNNVYYLSYAYGWPEKIAYATGSSPIGPWTYRGIVNEYVPNCGTNHQSIIEFNGTSYFIYHNGSIGGDYRRSVCIDYLYYNADGTMQQVIQTTTGIGGTTIAPTLAPTSAPTDPIVSTTEPTATPGPTSVPTVTPAGSTPEPTTGPGDTTAPTNPPASTDPPSTGCTCTNLCSSQTSITVPFTKDGTGEFCYTASSIGAYVNSWNADVVNVNGTNYTNTYVSSSSISAIDGVYYVYYKGSYSWSHLEIK